MIYCCLQAPPFSQLFIYLNLETKYNAEAVMSETAKARKFVEAFP